LKVLEVWFSSVHMVQFFAAASVEVPQRCVVVDTAAFHVESCVRSF
jgi:hypothetical protein